MNAFQYRCIGLILALATGSSLLQSCAGNRGGIVDDYPVLRGQLVSVALSQRGVPYVFGGTSPQTGFDCSGFVQYSYQQLGLQIPRNSYDQYKMSTPVYLNRLQPGDLVFFRTSSVFVSHVGIYIGGNRFVHAPGEGRPVSTDSLDSTYWRQRLVGAGSVLARAHLIEAEHGRNPVPGQAALQSNIEK
ncbi:MAG TPA: C40 family peptidase [Gammaproteobacteria bacterium]|nr:C40 family peptidase [Gammaproteobacteria bacterium]